MTRCVVLLAVAAGVLASSATGAAAERHLVLRFRATTAITRAFTSSGTRCLLSTSRLVNLVPQLARERGAVVGTHSWAQCGVRTKVYNDVVQLPGGTLDLGFRVGWTSYVPLRGGGTATVLHGTGAFGGARGTVEVDGRVEVYTLTLPPR